MKSVSMQCGVSDTLALEEKTEACLELKHLSEHLRMKTPITWFGYFRFTKERELTLLSTSLEVDQYYLANKHYLVDFSNLAFDAITNGISYSKSICPSFAAAETQVAYRKQFGLDNFLMIVKKAFDCAHVYMFASQTKQGHMINYYLNNIDFLQNFVTGTGEQVQAVVNRFNVPKCYVDYEEIATAHAESIFAKHNPDSSVFLNERQEAMVGLAHTDFNCLTERELQCLRFIIRGLTSKEIANELNISFRTVENYSARIKYKLGCRRKHDILRKYGSVL